VFKVAPLPRNLEACRRDFGNPDSRVRLSVVRDLGRGDSDRAGRIELLTRGLADADSSVRRACLIALADLGAAEALDQVLPLLRDVEIGVRQMAVLCLGEIAQPTDKEVVGRLASLLRAGDPSIRYQALIAHSQLLPEGAADDLENALKDEDPEVRELAIRLVDEVLLAAGMPLGEKLMAALRRASDEQDPRVRLVAQLVLGQMGEDVGFDMILLVAAGKYRVREPRDEQTALELAGAMRLFEAAPDLRRRAFGRFGIAVDPFRWVALSSLCRLGDARAFEKLKASLGARHLPDRTLAVEGLGTSGLTEALPLLRSLVGTKNIDPEVLERAILRLESE
jgi:HEAT repeat protein